MTISALPAASPRKQISARSEFWRDLGIATVYAVCGIAWILFSTYLIPHITRFDAEQLQHFELVKGYLFMLVSAALFFALLRVHSRHQRALRLEVVRSEEMAARHGHVLGMLASGEAVENCLMELLRSIEEERGPVRCLLILLGNTGEVQQVISPTIPESICRKMMHASDGRVGLCGAAAQRNERVLVTDTASDPLASHVHEDLSALGLYGCFCAPILAEDGTALGLLGMCSPLRRPPSKQELLMSERAIQTARIMLEHARTRTRLAESERVYRDLVEQSPVGICVASDASRRFETANPAMAAMLGYSSPAELQTLDLERDVYVDVAERRAFYAALREHGSCDMTVRCKRKDGRVILVRCVASAVRREGDHITARVSCEDVSGKLEIEARNQQAQRLESIGRLAGGIAHDFNNILMVTQSYAELLEPVVEHNEQALRFLREITKASGRAAELTRQLLAFSRKQPFSPQAVDLNERIRGSLTSWTRLLGRRVKITTHLGEGLPQCLMDSAQLEQVFLNLLLNARDAMPDGGEISISTSLDVATGGRRICMQVTDSGKGIAPDVLPNIFDPFFTTKDPGKGTGLGLASVYGILERAGGDIRVTSTVGEGTTFRVYLPIARHTTAPEAPASPEHPPTGALSGRVLLVEDEEGILETLGSVTRQMGLEVLTANCAERGLELLEQAQHIDLLVTDVVMPGMNGLELAEIVRRRFPSVKIMIVSGYARGEEDVAFQDYEFLLKPIGLERFRSAVRRVLDPERSR